MRFLLAIAIVGFAISRAAMLFALEPESYDSAVYHDDAAAIAQGVAPYSSALPIEYPPAAVWALRAPFALARRAPSLAQYRHAFRLEMAACDVVAFALVIAIARRRRPELAGAAAAAYVAVTTVLANLLYDRLDIALAALVLAWAYAFLRSRPLGAPTRPASLAWTALAYAALGLATSFKLIPLAIVPALAAYELRTRDRARMAVAAGAFAAAAAGPFVPYLPGALSVFHVHAVRGIQIESLYASIAALAAQLGAVVDVAPSYGSYNLIGTFADAAKPIATLAVAAVIAAIAYAAWRRRTLDAAYQLACLGLAAAVIASNVLSPQYFIWALPLALLVALDVAPARFGLAAAWALAVAALTTWIFPYHYNDVLPAYGVGPLPATFAHVVIAARNVLYLGFVVWLARSSTRVAPQLPLAASASA